MMQQKYVITVNTNFSNKLLQAIHFDHLKNKKKSMMFILFYVL